MTSLRCGGLLVAALAVIAPRDAQAFCRTTTAPVPANYDAQRNGCITSGLLLYWKGACVSYAVNENAAPGIPFADATRIIDQAFATWTGSICPASGEKVGIAVTDLGAVQCDEVRYNPGSPNQNLIVFREDKWPYNDAANTLGLTTVTFNAESGEIYDADMEINATGKNLSIADKVPANGFDLLSVVTHEAGHFLGLAHATLSTATMFASYKPGTTTLRSLTNDDIAGVCAIYPNDKERVIDKQVSATGLIDADACNPQPRHGFTKKCEEPADDNKGCDVAPATSSPPTFSMSFAAFGLGGVALIAAARRRRLRQ
jgi:MYXO-CTERM domain-containing protein